MTCVLAVVIATLVVAGTPDVSKRVWVLLRGKSETRRRGDHHTAQNLPPARRPEALRGDASTVMKRGGAVGGRRWVACPAAVLLWGGAVVQSSASPQHAHRAGALMLGLEGVWWSPVAGRGAAGGEDRAGESCRLGVGGVEEGSAAGAVTVETGPVRFVELD